MRFLLVRRLLGRVFGCLTARDLFAVVLVDAGRTFAIAG